MLVSITLRNGNIAGARYNRVIRHIYMRRIRYHMFGAGSNRKLSVALIRIVNCSFHQFVELLPVWGVGLSTLL